MKPNQILEFEQLVVSGLVTQPALIYEYPEELNEQCFRSGSYKTLFQLITKFVYIEGMPENELFVYLSSKAPELTTMWLKLSGDMQPKHVYMGAAQKLIDYTKRQIFINLGKEIVSMSELSDFNLDALHEKIFDTISSYTDRKAYEVPSIHTLGENLVETLQHPSNNDNEVKSGFVDLDKILVLDKGSLHVIAARPSMGKSALGFQIAYNVSKDMPVLVFSLEMSKEQVIARYVSSISDIKLWKIQKRVPNRMELDTITNKVSSLVDRKLYIDDLPSQSIQGIQRKARQWKLKHDIGFIMIDYLQLVKCNKENREQEIATISRNLKQIARELKIPVLVLSQLNRGVEMERDKRPKLSHLRESGAIEQDADSVSMLYRDDYYKNKDQARDNIAEVIIRKQRNGATGTVMLQWDGEKTTFRNYIKPEKEVVFDKNKSYNKPQSIWDGPR